MKKTLKRSLAILLTSVVLLSVCAIAASADSSVTLDLKRFIYSPTGGTEAANRTVPVEVEWGPQLFEQPATASVWDPELLWVSSILANNAYFQRLDDDPTARFFTPGKGDTRETLLKLGFDSASIRCVRAVGESDEEISHYNYVTFGQQTMTIGGQAHQLVAVMLRGTIDPEEWVSDFYYPEETYVPGFRKAEQAVLEALEEYLAENDPGLPRKLLITGHSRGATIANLLGADLNQAPDIAAQEDIFVYTFAPLNVAKKSELVPAANIWNFVNRLDIAPQVPPSNWDYGRFGTTVTLPADSQVEALFAAYSGLKAELANAGINAEMIAGLVGSIKQSTYNESNFPKLKPVILDIFSRDLELTYKSLEDLNKNSGAFFQALFGFTVDFQGLYTDLKSNLLQVIVYQHTPETYVARAKVMSTAYLERSDDKSVPLSIGYSWFLNRDEAVYEFVGAQGKVTWSCTSGADLIDMTRNSDGTVTVSTQKKINKTNMFFDFLPFVDPVTFTIRATDEAGSSSELTVKITIPIVLKLLGIIPVFGWIFFLFIL